MAVVDPTRLPFAMTVAAAAFVVFAVGYMGLPSRAGTVTADLLRRITAAASTARETRPSAPVRLFIVGSAAGLAQISVGNFGYIQNAQQAVSSAGALTQPLTVIGEFRTFGLALAAYTFARTRPRGAVTRLLVLLVLQLGFSALSGVKEDAALALVAVLLGYGAGAGRIPKWGVAAAVAAFVLVVVPFVTNYRTLVNVGGGRLGPAQAAGLIVRSPGSLLTNHPDATGRTTRQQIVDRLSRIGDLTVTVQKTPAVVPYRTSSTLAEAPLLAVVPRVVWPNKPVITSGYDFGQRYLNLPGSLYTANAVTPIGDLWQYGGWLTLIVGMLLLGAAVRVLDTYTTRVGQHPLCLFLALAMFASLVKWEIDVGSLLESIPSTVIGVAVACRLATRVVKP